MASERDRSEFRTRPGGAAGLRVLRLCDDGRCEPLAEDGPVEAVPLWRETKVVLDPIDLEARDLGGLGVRLAELERHLAADRVDLADALAEDCLARVLRFPEHRPWWWRCRLPAAALLLAGVLALVLTLAA